MKKSVITSRPGSWWCVYNERWRKDEQWRLWLNCSIWFLRKGRVDTVLLLWLQCLMIWTYFDLTIVSLFSVIIDGFPNSQMKLSTAAMHFYFLWLQEHPPHPPPPPPQKKRKQTKKQTNKKQKKQDLSQDKVRSTISAYSFHCVSITFVYEKIELANLCARE